MRETNPDNIVPLTVVPDDQKLLFLIQSELTAMMPPRRKELGLTQADLARKIMSTPERIAALEHTPNDMSFREAYAVIEALGLEIKLRART